MNLIEFGTIMHLQKGKKPSTQIDKPQEGYLPYVDIKAFETGIVDSYTNDSKSLRCSEGDLLIVCDGSRSGLVGRAIDGYVCSTLALISADGMLPEYLYYFLKGKYEILTTRKKGTGTPHLNPDILKKQKLIIPNETEQRKIVRRIEELFSELDNAESTLLKTKEQLAVYRQAVLKSVFSNLEKTTSIREMSLVVTSGSRGWAKYYSEMGAKFIRIGNLTRDRLIIDLSSIQYVDLPLNAEGQRTRLQPNDVLVSITADLGSIGLVPENIGEAYVNQHIAMIRFKNARQGEFMAWYLRSDYGQKELLKNKRGGGKLGLGLDDIRDSRVPDIDDETASKIVAEIENRLSVCDSIEQTVNTALQQLQAMRRSILKEAFEGRLS
ncbi:MAG: restriction endonuclease subunit S [Ruminococcus flavefaciens]